MEENNGMTKEAAIAAMEEGGYKVSHPFFKKEEYIYSLDDERYTYDNGEMVNKKEFWKLRNKPHWNTGWRIVG